VKADEKTNEITAIPNFLEVPTLQGSIVTGDATGCQKKTASKTTEKEAGCIPAAKGNQGSLEEDIKRTVRLCRPQQELVEEDFGDGRIESRKFSPVERVERCSKKRKQPLHKTGGKKRRNRNPVLYHRFRR
jgi:predicted transposase YbfD/YdcC